MKVVESCQIKDLAKIYETYFGDDFVNGLFVEVGAHDGRSYSNTFELANAGWTGIYIEPIHDMAEMCRGNHVNNNVKVIERAISNFDGELTLYTGPDIYTANPNVIDCNGNITVPCSTLNTLFEELGIKDINLLVIDVEFHEKEVLLGFDLGYYQPGMVIIEAHEHHENEKFKLNAQYINEYFQEFYDKIYSDGINNIYVLK